jgi:hypothetical protein
MAQQSTNNPASQTFLGRINTATNATNNRDLYLKLFSGEMFTGFQRETIARDLVMKRTLTNGKSLQFIYTGRTSAEYHTPGNSILGNSDKTPPVAEKTITVDDLLISSAFVYELDETLAHYELRGEISKKIGYALAQKYDRLIFRAIAKGARQASPVSLSNFVEPGGTQIQVGAGSNADDALDSAKLVTAFYDAAAALDEKGVSDDGRVAVLNPRQYYALIQEAGSNGLINRDVQGTALQSGNGVIEIAGIKIYKSMNAPFFSKYGTKYAPSSGASAATDLDTVDPGNTGSFVSESIETATTVTGNNYGPRQILPKRSCRCSRNHWPTGTSYIWRCVSCIPRRCHPRKTSYGSRLCEPSSLCRIVRWNNYKASSFLEIVNFIQGLRAPFFI